MGLLKGVKIHIRIAFIGLLLLVCSHGHCHTDPSTGRIRVLFLGEYYAANRIMLDWIAAEPRFELTVVPCSLQNVPISLAKKMTRLYIPRTYDILTSCYDILVLEDFGPMCLLDSAIENFRRGVEEAGMGLGLIEFANWAGTPVRATWIYGRRRSLNPPFPLWWIS